MTEAGQILDNASQATSPASTGNPSPTAATAVATPAVQKDEPVSGKLSVLMERERQAVDRERRAREQEEKLKDILQFRERFETLKKDPTKVEELLKEIGWDYDKLTQSRLQDGAVPPSVEIQQLRDQVTELREQLKKEKDEEAEAQKNQMAQAETKAVSDFKNEISEYLKSKSDRYELIEFEQAQDLVFDVIDEHYNRTINPETGVGEVKPIAEAADMVEEHLEKKYRAAREKTKVKAFWTNMPKPIQAQLEKQKEAAQAASQPPKTLTNNMGPKVSGRPSRLPEDQRIAAIIREHEAKFRSQFAG